MTPFKKAIDRWMDSKEGRTCLVGAAQGPYLFNRLHRAFSAGWSEATGEKPMTKSKTAGYVVECRRTHMNIPYDLWELLTHDDKRLSFGATPTLFDTYESARSAVRRTKTDITGINGATFIMRISRVERFNDD